MKNFIFLKSCLILLSACSGGGGGGGGNSGGQIPGISNDSQLPTSPISNNSLSGNKGGGTCGLNGVYAFCNQNIDSGYEVSQSLSSAIYISIENCNQINFRRTYYLGSTCSGEESKRIYTTTGSYDIEVQNYDSNTKAILYKNMNEAKNYSLGSNFDAIKNGDGNPQHMSYLWTDNCFNSSALSSIQQGQSVSLNSEECDGTNYPEYYSLAKVTEQGLYSMEEPDNTGCTFHDWTDLDGDELSREFCTSYDDLGSQVLESFGFNKIQ